MTVSAVDTVSRLESGQMYQFTPLQLRMQPFHLVVNCCCKLDLKERVTTYKMKRKPEQKQGGEGSAELLLKKSHATASLISQCCLVQLYMLWCWWWYSMILICYHQKMFPLSQFIILSELLPKPGQLLYSKNLWKSNWIFRILHITSKPRYAHLPEQDHKSWFLWEHDI